MKNELIESYLEQCNFEMKGFTKKYLTESLVKLSADNGFYLFIENKDSDIYVGSKHFFQIYHLQEDTCIDGIKKIIWVLVEIDYF